MGEKHHSPIENAAKKFVEAKGKEIFEPVRNTIEKPEPHKSVESGDPQKPSLKDVLMNSSGVSKGDSHQSQQGDNTAQAHSRRGQSDSGKETQKGDKTPSKTSSPEKDFTALQEQDQMKLAKVREELRKFQSFEP